MKNTKELRDFLLTQMQGVANGSVDVSVAKGVCNLAQQVYNTVNIEIKMATAKEKITSGNIPPVDFS